MNRQALNHPRPSFERETRSPGQRTPLKAPKARAWSHQDELKALVGKRVNIRVNLGTSTATYSGVLQNADQFTLQLVLNDQSTVTYFKSALISFGLAV